MNDAILLIEDNIKLLNLMRDHFRKNGFGVYTATSLAGTRSIIASRGVGVVVMDLMLDGESGMEGIDGFLAIDPLLQVIVVTGYASIDSAVEAIRKGAFDYIQKPVDIEHLQKTIDNALRFRSLKDENGRLRRQLISSSYCIHTQSEQMQSVFERANKLGRTELPILILGECGTGKEVIADYIQVNSNRSEGPYVKVNSSAFPDGLLENELFGHEKDSFTGANASYKGLFEQADKGTLFLDEIGDMGLSSQAKILRTLQNREVRRIGGSGTIYVDVRLIAASNMDIPSMIEEKRFRKDLYFRINTATIEIPPLRERLMDIPFLVTHFLQGRGSLGSIEDMISEEVMFLFSQYNWPGNVRELRSVIEYSLALSNGMKILPTHLPTYMQHKSLTEPGIYVGSTSMDRVGIEQALEKNRFNKKQTAECLGISRKTLYEKMKKYGIAY